MPPTTESSNPFARPPGANRWLLRSVAVPAMALALVILADRYLFTGVSITPVLNGVLLGVLALYLQPRPMVFWAFCLTVMTIHAVTQPFSQHAAPVNSLVTREMRSIGSVVGGALAVLLCANRLKVERSRSQLVTLLKQLPLPFVISDPNGTLIFASAEAARVMGATREEIVGGDYFSLLMNPSKKGETIERYLRVADSQKNSEDTIDLRLPSPEGSDARGLLLPVDLLQGRMLVTVITQPQLA